MGMLAAGAVAPGLVLDNMGSAEALTLPLEVPRPDGGLAGQGFNQGLALVDRPIPYVLTGLMTSAACVEWCRGLVAPGEPIERLVAAARAVPPGSRGTLFLALLLGTPAAYAVARFRFARWKNRDITIWFLSQRVLPPVATVVPFYLVMRALGLLDTHAALILVNATFVLPFVVVILRQTFLDLPLELEEAALVDGASHWGAFWRIALPLAAPTLAATGLIVFAFTWNEFLFAVALSSRNALTVPVHIAGAVDTRGVQFWFMGVRAMTAIVPPVLIALLAQRYIVRGLTLGAVKG